MDNGKTENLFSDYQMNFNMNINKSIVILAAGLGSRYKGLKQIDGITNNNSPILEYSIYDALEAGFGKVIVIINKHIPTSYIERLDKIAQQKNIELHWVYQDIADYLPEKFDIKERQKPWGTAHALLCVKSLINEPFIIINADDFYGKEIYKEAASIINEDLVTPHHYHIIAYPIKETVSQNGAVSRGICELDDHQSLTMITERTEIFVDENEIYFLENNHKKELHPETLVSMNYSIFHPSIFNSLEAYFYQFLNQNPHPKEEFLIPKHIQTLIDHDNIQVTVHTSPSQWMGMTYPEDKKQLKIFIENKITQKKYPEDLWS